VELFRSYKFVLSFENTPETPGYFTEKLVNPVSSSSCSSSVYIRMQMDKRKQLDTSSVNDHLITTGPCRLNPNLLGLA
jgi:hypothetical protein